MVGINSDSKWAVDGGKKDLDHNLVGQSLSREVEPLKSRSRASRGESFDMGWVELNLIRKAKDSKITT